MKTIDLVQPGSLVFDVGANVGSKTRLYIDRGARVVCFEPHPASARSLREQFGTLIKVAEVALGAEPGKAMLNLCTTAAGGQASEISSIAEHWKQGRFAVMKWSRQVEVEVDTIDHAILAYGRPSFVKIDVEGYEREVLSGLSQKVEALSFEVHDEFPEHAAECVARLTALGFTSFAVGVAEHTETSEPWVSAAEIIEQLPSVGWGDVYAR